MIPEKLGEAVRDLQVSEEYAKKVMRQWACFDEQTDPNRIAHELVWGYPAHSFIIDLEEAQRLGLHAEELDEKSDDLCDRILRNSHGGLFDIAFPDNNDGDKKPRHKNTPKHAGAQLPDLAEE